MAQCSFQTIQIPVPFSITFWYSRNGHHAIGQLLRGDCGTASGATIRWTITGTEGETEITTPEVMWQIAFPGATLKIQARIGHKVEVITSESRKTPGVAFCAFHSTSRG
ncbi:hypothetical protein OCU04_006478 [Sclerotinia nivalis]|uniref:Uncharacterized protein n=1 Tax=Sclerotinia nivalis TaxID=352851 RepID=A0A9X0ANC5_9HELO|nr:hypothetical protein OCU04_006478 [Sclerotinia nivalis]